MEMQQLGIAIFIGIITAAMVSGVVSPLYSPQAQTDTLTLLNATNVSTTYSFIALSETVTCNTTALVRTTEYIPYAAAGNILLTNNTWNNTACDVDYSYYSDLYQNDGLVRIVVSFIGVLVLIRIIMLAASG